MGRTISCPIRHVGCNVEAVIKKPYYVCVLDDSGYNRSGPVFKNYKDIIDKFVCLPSEFAFTRFSQSCCDQLTHEDNNSKACWHCKCDD